MCVRVCVCQGGVRLMRSGQLAKKRKIIENSDHRPYQKIHKIRLATYKQNMLFLQRAITKYLSLQQFSNTNLLAVGMDPSKLHMRNKPPRGKTLAIFNTSVDLTCEW